MYYRIIPKKNWYVTTWNGVVKETPLELQSFQGRNIETLILWCKTQRLTWQVRDTPFKEQI